ncbi:TRAM domain-containing protein [Salinicola aestuarinus]|uniref:TRAM domain-containing protein n=1 Tax=Salinicola aestuarinus TaxID=1949082 RepID=UPI000DA11C9E|nr:TRAM domain-containing protein [Salinicola aestuarinus]
MAMLGKKRTPIAKREHRSVPAPKPASGDVMIIERLAHDGRGVGRHPDGKTVFVDRALTGERVDIAVHRQRRRFDEAHVRQRQTDAVDRVTPPCEYFERCGGCDLQHLAVTAQHDHKRRVLAELLSQHAINRLAGGGDIGDAIEVIAGNDAGYRRRARLGVKRDANGVIHLGFRSRGSEQLVDIAHCYVLAPRLSALLPALRDQLESLEVVRHVGHIELLLADGGQPVVVVRQLRDVAEDSARWRDFATRESVSVALLKGREKRTLEWLVSPPALAVSVEGTSGTVSLAVEPGDFLQVNAEVNQRLIDTARGWLALSGRERLLDLFAGVGNFSLALAGDVHSVSAVEGSRAMVERLHANVRRNEITNVTAFQADLAVPGEALASALADHDTVLLDPPRDGADAVCRALATSGVERVLYVSCHAAALARDLATLCDGGFRLERLAMADMFAHTAHLEAVALLTRSAGRSRPATDSSDSQRAR